MSTEPIDERLVRVEGDVSGIKSDMGRIFSELKEIRTGLSQRDRTNWPIILSAVGVLMAVFIPSIGAMALFISLQIRTQISPLESKSDISTRDRSEIRDAMDQYGHRLIILEKSDSKIVEQLKEVETQVKSIYDIANMRESHSMQLVSMLWEKSNGTPLPLNTFYPQPKEMP